MGIARHGPYGSYSDIKYRLTYAGNGIPLPRNYFAGLVTSNDAFDTSHAINVAAGQARDVDDTSNIIVTEITKTIDETWTAGDEVGGLNDTDFASGGSDAEADTWYHFFILGDAGSSYRDAGFDKNILGTSLLGDTAVAAAGFTTCRRVASILTDGGNSILAYTQTANQFIWSLPVANDAVTISDNTPLDIVLNGAPTDHAVDVVGSIVIKDITDTDNLIFYSKGMADAGADISTEQTPWYSMLRIGTATYEAQQFRLQTDTAATIRAEYNSSDDGDGVMYIGIYGWYDNFGKYD